jgi:PAS domain S-box-containing protein
LPNRGGVHVLDDGYQQQLKMNDLRARTAAPDKISIDSADFAAMADNLPELAWMAQEDGWVFWYNRRWYEYTGTSPAAMEGWGWQSVHDPAVLPQVLERWRASIATGETFEMTFPLRGADGIYRPFLTRVSPLKDDAGRVTRWIGTNTDVSAQESTAAALVEEKRNFETLNRTAALVAAELNLDKLVQTVTDAGVALSGAAFGAFFYNVIDERGESYTLYTIAGVPREAFSKFPMPRNSQVFEPTFRGTGTIRSDDITKDPRYGKNEPYRGMPPGHLPVRSYLAVPVTSRMGEVLGGLFFGHPEVGVFTARHEQLITGIAAQAAVGIDNARLYEAAQRELAERRRAERHRQLLTKELAHRVKNTLATVQSIAAETLRNSAEGRKTRDMLDARLIALSETHNLLTRENWEAATLRDLASTILQPYCNDARRLEISGPEIRLPPKSALAVALGLHELMTNAIKHGALSVAGGKVALQWSLDEGAEGTVFRIHWSEHGGPPVALPLRTGFGTRLVERGLAAELEGAVRLAYEPTGLVCTIEAALPSIRQSSINP